jgi:hypothetical protein
MKTEDLSKLAEQRYGKLDPLVKDINTIHIFEKDINRYHIECKAVFSIGSNISTNDLIRLLREKKHDKRADKLENLMNVRKLLEIKTGI